MKITITLCTLLLCSGLVLKAADEPKKGEAKAKASPEEMFKKLDKNGDGKLSKEEFIGKKEGEAKEKAEKAFAAKDKDKDGFLTLEEFKAGGKKKDK
jgi:Ca2+-binding EF-hand superfamily protein